MSTGVTITFVALAASFAITFKAIPAIIAIMRMKNCTDSPDGKRKLHRETIPTLGGIAIFGGFMISCSALYGSFLPDYYSCLVASLLILFFLGVKDDILVICPKKKLAGQVFAALVIVYMGKICIPCLDGLLGIINLHPVAGKIFSVFTIVIIINAYNLIDGIDGLAGMVSFAGAVIFGAWFIARGHYSEAVMCFALLGALAGFICHNYEPAKIFMGDTGSQLIGFIMAVAGFRVMELNAYPGIMTLHSPSVFVFSVMIIPLFDTARVIAIRLMRGVSPMKADCNHMHHRLQKLGLRHSAIALILSFVTVLIVFTGLLGSSWNTHLYLLSVSLMAAAILPVTRSVLMIRKFNFNWNSGRTDRHVLFRLLHKAYPDEKNFHSRTKSE